MEKCFGMCKKDRKCYVVESKYYCRGQHEQCPFYKTEAQYSDEIIKCSSRLKSLPAETQAYIADKYFNGKYPWRKK